MNRDLTSSRLQLNNQPTAVLVPSSEEILVNDARAGLSPSQMVENKLYSLLKSTPMPLSQRLAGARRVYS